MMTIDAYMDKDTDSVLLLNGLLYYQKVDMAIYGMIDGCRTGNHGSYVSMTCYVSIRGDRQIRTGRHRIRQKMRIYCDGSNVSSHATSKKTLVDMNRRQSLLIQSSALCCSCLQALPAGSEIVGRNSFMDKLFANAMAQGMREYEESIKPVKASLFADLNAHLHVVSSDSDSASSLATSTSQPLLLSKQGTVAGKASVMELGCGAGPNLQFYDPKITRIEAIEPNGYMKPYFVQTMLMNDFSPASDLHWYESFAECVPLPDASVDAVVCTIVLCSVTNVERVLNEVLRVLKPGGKFVFVEHVAAPESQRVLSAAQYVFDPLQQMLADGCHLRRNPLPIIQQAGFSRIDRVMEFHVEGVGLISPHVAGICTA